MEINETLQVQLYHPNSPGWISPNEIDELQNISELILSAQNFRKMNRQELSKEIEKLQNAENQMKIKIELIEREMEKVSTSKMINRSDYLSNLIEHERKLRSLEKLAIESMHFLKNLQPKFSILNEKIQRMATIDAFKDSVVLTLSTQNVVSDSTQTDESLTASETVEDKTDDKNEDVSVEKSSGTWEEASMDGENSEDADNEDETEYQIICKVCEASFDTFARLFQHNARKHQINSTVDASKKKMMKTKKMNLKKKLLKCR